MKIAVSSKENHLEAEVDPRFGRAACFIIYDTATDEYTAVDNVQNMQAAQGAGIQAAQTVANHKVELVVSGNFGPKAFATLQAAGIKLALWSDGTVKQAIELAKSGGLQYATQANVEGHWT
jgi:predicted Fe-Mo cluster-binding NifX family protein